MSFDSVFLSRSSYSRSTSLCPGRQRHGHLGAPSVEGAQRQRRCPGLLSVLQWGWQTRLEHCQQQACYQHQVDGSDHKTWSVSATFRCHFCQFVTLSLFPRFAVHGLETHKTYLFRVKSVSHAGNSDYSKESEAIVVKAALRKDSTPATAASEMNKSYPLPYAQGQKIEWVQSRWKGRWKSLTPPGPYSDAEQPESQPAKTT